MVAAATAAAFAAAAAAVATAAAAAAAAAAAEEGEWGTEERGWREEGEDGGEGKEGEGGGEEEEGFVAGIDKGTPPPLPLTPSLFPAPLPPWELPEAAAACFPSLRGTSDRSLKSIGLLSQPGECL